MTAKRNPTDLFKKHSETASVTSFSSVPPLDNGELSKIVIPAKEQEPELETRLEQLGNVRMYKAEIEAFGDALELIKKQQRTNMSANELLAHLVRIGMKVVKDHNYTLPTDRNILPDPDRRKY